jgi:2-methylisocitrate lyase-like PEP mutase family enzyme
MIERCVAAVDAGADMIFLPHLRRRDLERVQLECSAPMMQIGTSRTPASESGAKVVIYPGDLLFASFAAVRESVGQLRSGLAHSLDGALFTDLNRTIGSPEAISEAERYGVVRPMESE